MQALLGVLSAFGLSASAGLNAYIPLLVVALMAKFTPWIKLSAPWDALTSWWVIGIVAFLLLIETFADKVPAVNHVNDIIQSFVRPAAGAVVFAASTNVITDIHPVVAIAAGLLVAGGVHAVKALAVRPAVTTTTGGGQPDRQRGRGCPGDRDVDLGSGHPNVSWARCCVWWQPGSSGASGALPAARHAKPPDIAAGP
jgi:hypothetical protein